MRDTLGAIEILHSFAKPFPRARPHFRRRLCDMRGSCYPKSSGTLEGGVIGAFMMGSWIQQPAVGLVHTATSSKQPKTLHSAPLLFELCAECLWQGDSKVVSL